MINKVIERYYKHCNHCDVEKMRKQFPQAIQILANALRAGRNIVNAFTYVNQFTTQPLSNLFDKIIRDNNTGMHINKSIESLADTLNDETSRMVVLAIKISEQSGGRLPLLLDEIVQMSAERSMVSQKIGAITTQGVVSIYIISFIPIVILLMMSVVAPSLVKLLFLTPLGVLFLIVGTTLQFVGIKWMKSILHNALSES